METRGEFRVDPGSLSMDGAARELEVVVPFTVPETTAAALDRAPVLTAGLDAHILLLAVHTLPYPLPFVCPSLAHAYLVEQLMELAGHCALPVHPQVVLSRDFEEGFRFALKPSSTVLLATRRQFWRTREERLARVLARNGHKVALVHIG
jgi:hypothetical protein